jgi:molecular chaperone HtpG
MKPGRQDRIQLQPVFVADNIKEIIPEFLFLLKGCITAGSAAERIPQLSQNGAYVGKLSTHIIKRSPTN